MYISKASEKGVICVARRGEETFLSVRDGLSSGELVLCRCKERLDWLGELKSDLEVIVYEACSDEMELDIDDFKHFELEMSLESSHCPARMALRHLLSEPKGYLIFLPSKLEDSEQQLLQLVTQSIAKGALSLDFLALKSIRSPPVALSRCQKRLLPLLATVYPSGYEGAAFLVSPERRVESKDVLERLLELADSTSECSGFAYAPRPPV